MNIQNEIAATVIGNRMSDMANRNRRDMILQWLKRLLIALLMVLGPSLKAENEDPTPPANYILAPASGAKLGIGQVVTFKTYSASGTYRPTWHFGDGAIFIASALTCTHTYSVAGTYTVTLVYPQVGGSNNGTPSVTYAISITVLARPTVSVFSASPAAINRGQSATLNWAVSGSDLSVGVDQGIGAVSASGSRFVSPSSTTTYTLTASNISGSVTAKCIITLNQPPVISAISIPTFDAQKAMSIVLPASATDPENQALTYTATGLPSGLSFNSSTRTLSGAVAVPGIYSFTYTATDTKGASASTKGTLTVKAAGVIPTGGTTTTIKYDYDTQGRLSTLTYPSGRAAGYTYDYLDRVTTVTYNGQAVVQPITYDAWGNPSSRQFKSGARDEWTYDASGTQVTQWSIGIVGGTPQARAYGYDTADRLTKAGEWTNLAYDANSRLTEAVAPSFSIDNVLAHDAYNNNISSVTTSAGSVPSAMNNFTFDPMVTNHLPGQAKNGGLTGVSETNFGEITNLAAGISASTGLSMTWDGLGRMTSTTYGTSRAVESFRYTASGLRIIRTDSLDANKNRYYAYANDGHMLAKYQFASGANPVIGWCADILYLGNEAIAQVDGAGAHAFHNDHQGTPRVITSPAGTVEGTQAFGPYGEQIQHSGYSPIIGYTGHILTEPTGLIYMRGRFYSPAWHRFMNSNRGVDPNLINQFAYTIGSPLMMTDVTGMDVGSPGYDLTSIEKNKWFDSVNGGRNWTGYSDLVDDKLARDSIAKGLNKLAKTSLMGQALESIKQIDQIDSAEETARRIGSQPSSDAAVARNTRKTAVRAARTGLILAESATRTMYPQGDMVEVTISTVHDPSLKKVGQAALTIAGEVTKITPTTRTTQRVAGTAGNIDMAVDDSGKLMDSRSSSEDQMPNEE